MLDDQTDALTRGQQMRLRAITRRKMRSQTGKARLMGSTDSLDELEQMALLRQSRFCQSGNWDFGWNHSCSLTIIKFFLQLSTHIICDQWIDQTVVDLTCCGVFLRGSVVFDQLVFINRSSSGSY